MELREKIARAVVVDIQRQTDGAWPHDAEDGLSGLVDDFLHFGQLADAILAIPEIAEALETSRNLRANQERQHRMTGPGDEWLEKYGGGMMPGG